MQYRIVADSHLIADNRRDVRRHVDRNVVLDIRAATDPDRGQVTTEDRPIKNRGILAHFHVTHEKRPVGNEHTLPYAGRYSIQCYKFRHATNV